MRSTTASSILDTPKLRPKKSLTPGRALDSSSPTNAPSCYDKTPDAETDCLSRRVRFSPAASFASVYTTYSSDVYDRSPIVSVPEGSPRRHYTLKDDCPSPSRSKGVSRPLQDLRPLSRSFLALTISEESEDEESGEAATQVLKASWPLPCLDMKFIQDIDTCNLDEDDNDYQKATRFYKSLSQLGKILSCLEYDGENDNADSTGLVSASSQARHISQAGSYVTDVNPPVHRRRPTDQPTMSSVEAASAEAKALRNDISLPGSDAERAVVITRSQPLSEKPDYRHLSSKSLSWLSDEQAGRGRTTGSLSSRS
ncbi:uncharacterized protein FIBRA_06951 [Fibroporia radiculosa]|uniref:Uncharacterized protein n=1 Tax=Fibroporia radiculosa TaxID=599839 RepID=J4IBJ3_9APHY|nr:uncharacterized protein FIBRA_06951 [Fibroporia radiculosa]CCM04761.1 predicted protein [Fibroporia radiculosa]